MYPPVKESRVGGPNIGGLGPRTVWLLVLAFAVVAFALGRINAQLHTTAAPLGIVSFEFIWTETGARRILSSWDAKAREFAAFSLGLDYLFMGIYAVLLWALLARLAGKVGRFARAARPLRWLPWIAASFDALENVALWWVLEGAGRPWPAVASTAATAKFVALAVAATVWLLGIGGARLARSSRPTDPKTDQT